MITRRNLLLSAAAAPAASIACAATSGEHIVMSALYSGDGSFSEFAKNAAGTRITVEGFMAPPLKADSQFFVLTEIPMSVCPFCSSAAEWPNDILAVYTKRTVDVVPFIKKIETSGVLELGEYKDPETGFVSLIRLSDAVYN